LPAPCRLRPAWIIFSVAPRLYVRAPCPVAARFFGTGVIPMFSGVTSCAFSFGPGTIDHLSLPGRDWTGPPHGAADRVTCVVLLDRDRCAGPPAIVKTAGNRDQSQTARAKGRTTQSNAGTVPREPELPPLLPKPAVVLFLDAARTAGRPPINPRSCRSCAGFRPAMPPRSQPPRGHRPLASLVATAIPLCPPTWETSRNAAISVRCRSRPPLTPPTEPCPQTLGNGPRQLRRAAKHPQRCSRSDAAVGPREGIRLFVTEAVSIIGHGSSTHVRPDISELFSNCP